MCLFIITITTYIQQALPYCAAFLMIFSSILHVQLNIFWLKCILSARKKFRMSKELEKYLRL
jgi:hypothetical protein